MLRALVLAILLAQAQAQAQAQPEGDLSGRPFTTPNPDPTRATKEQLELAIAGLKELVFNQFAAERDATNLRLQAVSQIPSIVDEKISASRAVTDERFKRVDTALENIASSLLQRDANVKSTLDANQAAADRALTETKLAVDKANTNTKENIAQNNDTLREVTGSLQRAVDELKAGKADLASKADITDVRTQLGTLDRRLGAIENRQIGQGEARQGLGENVGLVALIVAGVVGIGGLVIAMRKPEPQPQPQRVVYVPQSPQPGVTTTTNTQGV